VEQSSTWTTQQLTEFLSVVSSVPDPATATREALERSAAALEAELGAVVVGDGVVASFGFPAGSAPERELVEVARSGDTAAVTLPGIGRCSTAAVPLEGDDPGWILLARIGEAPFDRADVSLLRGMARVLALTLRMLALVEVERAQREESQRRAFTDPLTGLANRALLLDRLDQVLKQAQRRGGEATLLFVDLDRFKVVNDSLGHSAGDALLEAVAERLRGVVRAGEMVARLGGDEFAILLEGEEATAANAVRVARRIGAALREPFFVADHEVTISASIGIASGSGAGPDLLRDADVAMYRAKSSGKGRYRVFEPAMHADALARLELDAALRHAIDRDELVVHYQPIVDLADATTVAVEALVRWQHPERGLVSPAEFIPIAEETGLIVDIGTWVLREACRQVAEWQAASGPGEPPLLLTVNVSGRQLTHPDLADLVCTTVAEAGLATGSLILELTETVLMQDIGLSVAQLHALKGHQVQIAIDDFGTGYSSLQRLQSFPIDILKIAKPFVDELSNRPDTAILARAIADLGRNLGLDTIAEGIEAPPQWRRLRDFGCRLGQGFLFSRPLPPSELHELLAGRLRTNVGTVAALNPTERGTGKPIIGVR
jgi:diguanylate cyclase (GGDEF)-like protein